VRRRTGTFCPSLLHAGGHIGIQPRARPGVSCSLRVPDHRTPPPVLDNRSYSFANDRPCRSRCQPARPLDHQEPTIREEAAMSGLSSK
jgi:hypothetical protein